MKYKTEFIKGFGVLVDESAEIKQGYKILCDEKIQIADSSIFVIRTCKEINNGWIMTEELDGQGENPKHTSKIICAEKELNIDVPILPNFREWEVEQLADNAYPTTIDSYSLSGFDESEALKIAFVRGYDHNKAKYTEEDLRKVAQAAFTVKSNNSTIIEDFNNWFAKRVQSFERKPKYIELDSESCLECKGDGIYIDGDNDKLECPVCDRGKSFQSKLIINSENKKEVIIKEIFYEN